MSLVIGGGESVNKGRTLEEVVNFSKTIEYKPAELFSPTGAYIALFSLLVILLGIALVVYYRQVFGLALVAISVMVILIITLASQSSVSNHNSDLRKMKMMVWEREYAQPYLRELKVTRTDAFQSFSYDYELEREKEKPSHDKQERKDSEKPVLVKMSNGNDALFWAEVIYDPTLKTDYMEYKYLTAELRFEERRRVYKEAGYQDVKIYTNKP